MVGRFEKVVKDLQNDCDAMLMLADAAPTRRSQSA